MRMAETADIDRLIVRVSIAVPDGSLPPSVIALDPADPLPATHVEHQFAKIFRGKQGLGRLTLGSQAFDLDNGAGTTVDELMFVPLKAIKPLGAYAAYSGATTGTVAAGNFKIGTTVGGGEVVAATAYENAKTVGTVTVAALASAAVIPAGTPIWIRHTGVAAVQAGLAQIVFEFAYDDEYCNDDTIVHVALAAGEVFAVEGTHITKPTGDQTLTVDVKKNGTTILTAPIALDTTLVDSDVLAAAMAAGADYEAGDIISMTWAHGGSSGVNGKKPAVAIWFREFPG
ncbi:MAG: hypothetical protein ACKVT0_09200 [Planctomycetaceae bacterium]